MTTQSTPTNSDTLPQGTRIGRTALRVGDLEEMTGFYRDVVGLSVLRTADTTSVLGVDDTPLLVLEGTEDTLQRHRSAAGLYHNAFRVPSRAALGDALARIRDQWQLGGASDHWVSEALYLTDPEGNGIEIYRDYPREDWPIADDGRVRISTEPLDLASIEAAATGGSQAPSGTDVGHVHLEVSSLDAFRDFYVDTLGFEVQTTVPAASFVSAGGYHHHIGANTWNHRSKPVGGRGLSWFEVVLPGTEVLNVIRERISDSQYTITARDEGIAVTGPDEIEVRLRG
ncbi:VOC family protein [Halobacterium salinarum]|uniref:VOC family protein n=1 Tax=Halobacterium salinarum TaxID=2242 RepID=UPI001F404D1C|nr:VOC family protein [Halobacterium salinarum]MCF2206419.1 VOC family protein [Halobacterium salinarum]MCF2240049.1 VOC family protein [Halobacterium salinarum]